MDEDIKKHILQLWELDQLIVIDRQFSGSSFEKSILRATIVEYEDNTYAIRENFEWYFSRSVYPVKPVTKITWEEV